ncbi:EF-hand domain pair [Trinorchestia longiramus]|nr:EF-hand domain pair [Trinorchestia longiramus]
MKVCFLILSVFAAATTAMPGATDDLCQIMKETFMKKIQTRAARDFVPLSSVKKSSFHSCDVNSNRALEGAEFAGCLHPLVTEDSKLGEDALRLRLDCFRKFKRQADKNDDDRVTKEEFDNWTKLGFFDMVLAASEQTNVIENPGITDVEVFIDNTPASSRQVKDVFKIIKALVKGDTGLALVRVYGLLTGTDVSGFDVLLIEAVSNALDAISAGDIPSAIGYVFSIVAGVVVEDNDDITVTQATISSVGSLLTSIINNDSEGIATYVGLAVTGVLVDLAGITYKTAEAISVIVVSMVTGTYDGMLTDSMIDTLSRGLAEFVGISNEARDSLIILIQAIRDNDTELIQANVFIVISAIAGAASGIGEATSTTLTLLVQALVADDRTEAVLQTATLYNLLSNGGTCSESKFSIFG